MYLVWTKENIWNIGKLYIGKAKKPPISQLESSISSAQVSALPEDFQKMIKCFFPHDLTFRQLRPNPIIIIHK